MFAQAFDVRRLALTGEPFPVVGVFPTRVGGAVQGINRQQYMVSADGKRFLMNMLVEDASRSPISVIINWQKPSNP